MKRAVHIIVLLALGLWVCPAPALNRFVTGHTLGAVRNDFSGEVGMKITVGGEPVTVTHLGRICLAGNQGVRRLRMVEAASGEEVAGSAVDVGMAGGTVGEFVHGALARPVVLLPGRAYYLVSLEVAGGDAWCDVDSIVTTAPVAAVECGIFRGSGYGWSPAEEAGHTYGPLDFKWGEPEDEPETPVVVDAPALIQSFVTEAEVKTVRNNFSGWVGMKLRVGADPLEVSSLGRFVFQGNAGTHRVKLVRAADQKDLAGGSVQLSLAGAVPGGFLYGAFAAPVRLKAETEYYLVSEEVWGGDLWGDLDTRVVTTDAAVIGSSVYFGSGFPWTTAHGMGDSYVPLSFKYAVADELADPSDSGDGSVGEGEGGDGEVEPAVDLENEQAYISFLQFSRTERNDFNGFVGIRIVMGSSPVRVTRLGRMFLEGNSEVHRVKIVDGATEQDVPGGSVEIPMFGGRAREFVYGRLPAPVILEAGHAYYIVTEERVGGDRWYDLDTWANTLPVATLVSPVYKGPSTPWTVALRPVTDASHLRTYGPVDFKFVSLAASPVVPSRGEVQFAWEAQVAPMLDVRLEGGLLEIALEGQAGNYVVEGSDDLKNWELFTSLALTGEVVRAEASGELVGRRRFFRARLQIP